MARARPETGSSEDRAKALFTRSALPFGSGGSNGSVHGGSRGVLRRAGRGGLGCLGPGDIDTSFEVGAVLDDDAGSANVADELRFLADLDAFGGFHVALHGAEGDHFARLDGGADVAVGSDGQLVLGGFDGSFHVAIDEKVFFAVNLAGDSDGFSDGGGTASVVDSAGGRAGHRHRLLPE